MSDRAGINRPMASRGRPSLTGIDADKGALGDVVQATDAPAFVLGFEELQADLQAVLHQPVGAHLGAAVAPLVALVDPAGGDGAHALRPGGGGGGGEGGLSPCGEALFQSFVQISGVLVNLAPRGAGCGLAGQLVAGALGPAVETQERVGSFSAGGGGGR